jgi:hypothetical protein
VAGRVEAVGENVTQFQPGDEVFGCGHGAFAEYVLAREAYVALKPVSTSFEEARRCLWQRSPPGSALRWRHQPGQRFDPGHTPGGVGTLQSSLPNRPGRSDRRVQRKDLGCGHWGRPH